MSGQCEKCGKTFNKKSSYNAHLKRKTPCNKALPVIPLIEKAIPTEKAIPAAPLIGEAIPAAPLIEEAIPTEKNIPTEKALPANVTAVKKNKTSEIKPILKWVGGKTQIIEDIIAEFPNEINNYREIFLGGGSVLLAFLTRVRNGAIKMRGNIYAYDINEPLIWMYKNIQTKHNELYDAIQPLIADFLSCPSNGQINIIPRTLEEAKQARENYYYWIRDEYNRTADKKTPLASAMLIFLNKTCFRGVFRIGPNGFNVPYGRYASPEIINREHLNAIHNLIQGVAFECCDFAISISRVELGDYTYLDPPYAPEKNNSFVKYTESGFDIETHKNLFRMVAELTKSGKRMMMSNSDTPLIRENFAEYNIKTIVCKRSINSKKPDAKTNEVIIKNY